MNNPKTILNLLCEGSLRLINGQSIEKNQRNYLAHNANMESYGGRLQYLTGEYLAAENFIKGGECFMRSICYLDQINIVFPTDLYKLWTLLPAKEKEALNYEVFGKYRELYEKRSLTRDGKIKVSDMSQPDSDKNIEIKLRSNISLLKHFNNKNYSNILPDTDFLRKFTVGLVKYFMKDYLYTGKLASVQREKDANDVFNMIRSISDQEDDRFRKIANSVYVRGEEHLSI